MSALRCAACKINWPNRHDYVKCPVCQKHTLNAWLGTPIGDEEAHSLKCHAEFERWLDEHDRRGPVDKLEQIPVR
jgi:hypothetical protein